MLVAACFFAAWFGIKSSRVRELPLLGQLAPGMSIPVLAEGVVVSEPSVGNGPWGSTRCEIALDALGPPSDKDKTMGRRECGGRKIWATLRGSPRLVYGDRLRIRGGLHLPAVPRNPGEFDFPAFLETRGILAEIDTAGPGDVLVTGLDAANPAIAAALRLRERVRAAITLDLVPADPEVAGVIAAMVLGAREDAPDEMVDDFKLSGTLHLFAVSGLHVGMIALILLALIRIPRVPRPAAAVLVIAALICYAFVTGLRPSAVRATIMAAIMLSGPLFDRQARILNSLGLAALVILAFDPFQALAPGFQLSFSVLLAIALLTSPLQRLLAPLASPDPFLPRSLLSRNALRFHAGAKTLADNVAVSTAASLGSLPLMLAYFHLATPVAVIANCFLVPLAFCVIFAAVVSVLLQLLALPGLGVVLNNANFLLVKLIAFFIAVFAAVPGGHFYTSMRPWFVRETCEIEVLDIPNGGAAHAIQTRSGSRWLLDTGGAREYEGLLEPFFRSSGLNRLDGMVLTHADSEHIGGAVRTLAAYRPRETFVPLKDYRSPHIRALVAELEQAAQPPGQLTRGDVLRIDDETEIRVLFPPPDHDAALADDHCPVLQLACGEWRVLFAGDSGFETWRWLGEHAAPGELASDVLVTGHHGSDAAPPEALLAAVRPRALVASNSANPKAERIPDSLRRACESSAIRLFDQAQTGAVRISLSPRKLSLTPFLGGEPFLLESARNEARPVEIPPGL